MKETNEEMNKVNETKQPLEEVLGVMLQMIQHMHNVTNMEAAKILHKGGHCGTFIDNCPLCQQEGEEQ